MTEARAACSERIANAGGWGFHNCGRKTVEGGKCRIHSPSYRAMKNAKADAVWEEERARMRRGMTAQRIGFAVLALSPEVLSTLPQSVRDAIT